MEYTPTAFLLSGKPSLFPGTKEQQQNRGKHGHKKAPQQPHRLKGGRGYTEMFEGMPGTPQAPERKQGIVNKKP